MVVPKESTIYIEGVKDSERLSDIVNGLVENFESYLNAEVISILPDDSDFDYPATQVIKIKC